MNTQRFLTISNFLGVLVLTAIVSWQWLREKKLHAEHGRTTAELAAANELTAEKSTRVGQLEDDVRQLKEAVTSTAEELRKKDAELQALAADRAEKEARLATQTTTVAENAREKISAWEKAIADRDEKIKELGREISATRKRLDEAIGKLREAGAR